MRMFDTRFSFGDSGYDARLNSVPIQMTRSELSQKILQKEMMQLAKDFHTYKCST